MVKGYVVDVHLIVIIFSPFSHLTSPCVTDSAKGGATTSLWSATRREKEQTSLERNNDSVIYRLRRSRVMFFTDVVACVSVCLFNHVCGVHSVWSA